ncbi:hypothetical protein [Janthinobacterium sp. PSPC3-1]|uniref:hypothetical protein n=1 Tax=Janthinobacterium sp. PSPC3-1 TaxID=2804653 RepID=UPI003CE7CC9F
MSHTASAAPTTSLASTHVALPIYSYPVLVAGKNGKADYHLFLMAGAIKNATWEDAAAYAAGRGGALPTRAEMDLIGELDSEIYSGPYWTADRADGSRALAYSFSSGIEGYSHTSSEFMARVVRRDPVEVWADTPVALPAKSPIILAANDGALLDAELWPIDCELLAEIRATFLKHWGMSAAQADIRMAKFNYQAACAALEGGAA